MGKDKKTSQSMDVQQDANTTFNNSEFLQNLQQTLQALQQTQQNQQTQQQSGTTQQTGTTQQVAGVDAASQAFIDQMRQHALGGAGQIGAGSFAPSVDQINALTQGLQNPFQQQVLGGLNQQFDQLRNQAQTGVQQQATAAGAFGGSRHGVAEAQRLAELDRAQTQQTGQLLSQGFQSAQAAALPLAQQQAMAPVQALMAQQGLLAGGLGPTGQVTTGTQQQMSQQDMLSSLLGLSSLSSLQQGTSSGTQTGFQSGQQAMRGTSSGRGTKIEEGNLFQDLLGSGLVLGGLGWKPFGGGS